MGTGISKTGGILLVEEEHVEWASGVPGVVSWLFSLKLKVVSIGLWAVFQKLSSTCTAPGDPIKTQTLATWENLLSHNDWASVTVMSSSKFQDVLGRYLQACSSSTF